jgi:hypothetical protein
MTTKKDCIQRAARELNDSHFAQRVADRAEALNYRGYEAMIREGKELFMRDLEELQEAGR